MAQKIKLSNFSDIMGKQMNDLISKQSADTAALKTKRETELGLPTLRQEAGTLMDEAAKTSNRLTALPEEIKNESRGFDVNSAQLNRITDARKAPINTQLGNTANAYSAVAGRLNTAENTVANDIKTLADTQAREWSGFTTEMQNQLDILLTKYKNGEALKAADKANLANLAAMEKQYDLQLRNALAEKSAQSTYDTTLLDRLTPKETTPAATTPNASSGLDTIANSVSGSTGVGSNILSGAGSFFSGIGSGMQNLISRLNPAINLYDKLKSSGTTMTGR